MTPSIAIVRIETPHWRTPGLWIPLFLLWIPALLLSPLILLVVAGVCAAFGVNFLRAVAVFWSIACDLPGTNVRVCANGNKVQVRVL